MEATAFGSRAINERLLQKGVEIEGIVALGGIARKSSFVMQTMADVLGVPIRVAASDQACALGAAICAAVAAGIYPTIEKAQKNMCQGYDRTYVPNPQNRILYDSLYQDYLRLGAWFSKQTSDR